MKLLLILGLFISTTANWGTDLSKAKTEATEKHELILLNFSGSDWCLPCIQMKKTIFNSDEFNSYAKDKLVLVNADFPRKSKNKLSGDQVKQNEALADKYNPEGKFPYTILLSADGKVLKSWDGLPDVKPNEFIQQIDKVASAKY
jgi:thioredoxin-related protein